jgi:hypothetical protein
MILQLFVLLYFGLLFFLIEIDSHGLDEHGGPLYIGSGCYHRRESLLGEKYDETRKLKLVKRERDYKSTVLALEQRAKNLITCTFEDNTQWGNEVRTVLSFHIYVSLFLCK